MARLALLLPAAVMGALPAVNDMTPDAKRVHYEQSLTRCSHGHKGGAIFKMAHEDHLHPFRTFLQDTHGETVSHVWEHLRMVATSSVKTTSLEAAFSHEHTRHVEANCVIKRTLPTPIDSKESAQIFDGIWSSSDSPTCEYTINSLHPWSTSSTVANISGYKPAAAFGNAHSSTSSMSSDCDGVTDLFFSNSLAINMTGPNHGTIMKMMADGTTNTLNGEIVIDPMGNVMDSITWSDGTTWTRLYLSEYDKETAIGPLTLDASGVETRNKKASPRWNWGLDRIDSEDTELDNLYDYGAARGNGSVLYHLDTGIYGSHDEFQGRISAGYSAGCPTGAEKTCDEGWIYGGVLTYPYIAHELPALGIELEDHGTHTASTVLGKNYGVAKEAKGYSVQVLSSEGVGATTDLIDGISWVLAKHIATHPKPPSVISMSLGMSERSELMEEAVKVADHYGILVVVAAGNDMEDACAESPSESPQAVTVGASGMMAHMTLEDGSTNYEWRPRDILAYFSNYGPCIDIIAPGVEILAAYSSDGSTHLTAALSGTSMATPLVSGVALTIRALYPDLSTEDVTRALLCIAQPGKVLGHWMDAYTSNLLLQGGRRVITEWSEIIQAQMELTVAEREYQDAHGVVQTTWDATTCHYPDAREQWNLPTAKAKRMAAKALKLAAEPSVLQPKDA